MKNWYRPRWRCGAANHPGSRSEQQDCNSIMALPQNRGLLAVVADGMGGHRDGALAARAVVATAEQFVQSQFDYLRDNSSTALVALSRQAHRSINSVSAAARSTLVVLWLYQDQARWLHAGDSRLYHFRAGQRLARTRDHSVAQMLVDLGEISEAEMAQHPDQNRLYRSLGGEEPPRVDLGGGQVSDNDLFALCTDGVWKHVSDAELWQRACAKPLTTAAQELVGLAVARAGPQADNATLAFIRPVPRRAWLGRWFQPPRG